MVRIAIVPYRDRELQLGRILPVLQRNFDRVVVAEQAPGRPFNRGLAKNVGYVLAAPLSTDTVVFHDVDLLAGGTGSAQYRSVDDGRIEHLYGHLHCLGGVVAMRAATVVALDGFCNNLWEWGGEDRALQLTAAARRIPIDRSRFTQRFENAMWFAELAADGVPQTNLAEAKALFYATAQTRKPVLVAPNPVTSRNLAEASVIARGRAALVRRDDGVERWVFEP